MQLTASIGAVVMTATAILAVIMLRHARVASEAEAESEPEPELALTLAAEGSLFVTCAAAD